MPIEKVDISLPHACDADVPTEENQHRRESEQKTAESHTQAATQKVAERKIAEMHAKARQDSAERETFHQHEQMHQIQGTVGPDAQHALGGFQNNAQLQGKLSEAQKNLFREVMEQSPKNSKP
jgi:hypothetical protein